MCGVLSQATKNKTYTPKRTNLGLSQHPPSEFYN